MSRRARKGSKNKNMNPVPIIIGMIIALAVVAGVVFVPKIIAPEGDAPPLNIERYAEGGSKANAGNKNSVVAPITGKESIDGGDLMLFVRPEEGSDGKKPKSLAIFVSKAVKDQEGVKDLNLNTDSSYVFTVVTSSNGMLEAEYIRSK